MPNKNNRDRREFLQAAAFGVAAAPLVFRNPAHAQAMATGTSPLAFATVKQIDAGVLNVGYVEAGPSDGPPVVLLHGWPYDIHSFVEVTPMLATAGYRVVVPY